MMLHTWLACPTAQITAYSFELGCVVHSVLIGVALGVIDNDFAGVCLHTRARMLLACVLEALPAASPPPFAPHPAAVRNFTIALAFHQVLEGVGLGAFISAADFSLLKGEGEPAAGSVLPLLAQAAVLISGHWLHAGLLMVAAYSVTAPLGIGIGIGVSSSYEPNSIAASASQVGRAMRAPSRAAMPCARASLVPHQCERCDHPSRSPQPCLVHWACARVHAERAGGRVCRHPALHGPHPDGGH